MKIRRKEKNKSRQRKQERKKWYKTLGTVKPANCVMLKSMEIGAIRLFVSSGSKMSELRYKELQAQLWRTSHRWK